jgi:hypothetical protein
VLIHHFEFGVGLLALGILPGLPLLEAKQTAKGQYQAHDDCAAVLLQPFLDDLALLMGVINLNHYRLSLILIAEFGVRKPSSLFRGTPILNYWGAKHIENSELTQRKP